jgi:hypothetical protein
MADFAVENHGSLFLLYPITPAAFYWIADCLPADAQKWGEAVVIEHRFIEGIVAGIKDDGLEVR